MIWDWQTAIADKYNRQAIFDDILKENSTLLTLAKEDVAKILQKTNYSFVVQKLNFDDIYNAAIHITKIQITKILSRKKGFLFCKDINCTFENLDLVKKIIQRIANNIKNLFDERYRSCIKKELFHERQENFESAIDENDALTILIKEEDAAELKAKTTDEKREYLQYMREILRVDSNGQTLLSFM